MTIPTHSKWRVTHNIWRRTRKMKISNQEDRITLWRFAYARTALSDARRWCRKIHTKAIGMDPDLRAALVQAIVISYSRPFTGSNVTKDRRIRPTGNIPPPTDLDQAHKDVIDMRNKLFGHKDGTLLDDSGMEINRVIFRFDKVGFDLHTITITNMADERIAAIEQLCVFS